MFEDGGIFSERQVGKLKMLTPAEIAERLNISYCTALDMVKYSGIPYVKVGRQYRVNEDVLNNLLTQDETIIIDYKDVT